MAVMKNVNLLYIFILCIHASFGRPTQTINISFKGFFFKKKCQYTAMHTHSAFLEILALSYGFPCYIVYSLYCMLVSDVTTGHKIIAVIKFYSTQCKQTGSQRIT